MDISSFKDDETNILLLGISFMDFCVHCNTDNKNSYFYVVICTFVVKEQNKKFFKYIMDLKTIFLRSIHRTQGFQFQFESLCVS